MVASTLLLIFSTLSLSSLLVAPAFGVPRETIAAVCSQTQNQETCQDILMSDPRTASADLPLLSLISIEVAQKQAGSNLGTFAVLMRNSTGYNASLEEAYATCVSLYWDIAKDLEAAHRLSKERKYGEVAEAGPSTETVYKCENGLPDSSPTAGITVDMLLTLEMFSSVAMFVARST